MFESICSENIIQPFKNIGVMPGITKMSKKKLSNRALEGYKGIRMYTSGGKLNYKMGVDMGEI
jgi:hypothetical protein